eukprot:g735.t1
MTVNVRNVSNVGDATVNVNTGMNGAMDVVENRENRSGSSCKLGMSEAAETVKTSYNSQSKRIHQRLAMVDKIAKQFAGEHWRLSVEKLMKKKSIDISDLRSKLAEMIRSRREQRLLESEKRDELIMSCQGKFLRAVEEDINVNNFHSSKSGWRSGSRVRGREAGGLALTPAISRRSSSTVSKSSMKDNRSSTSTAESALPGAVATAAATASSGLETSSVYSAGTSSAVVEEDGTVYRPLERIVNDPNPYNSLLTSLLLNSLRRKRTTRRKLKAIATNSLAKILSERSKPKERDDYSSSDRRPDNIASTMVTEDADNIEKETKAPPNITLISSNSANDTKPSSTKMTEEETLDPKEETASSTSSTSSSTKKTEEETLDSKEETASSTSSTSSTSSSTKKTEEETASSTSSTSSSTKKTEEETLDSKDKAEQISVDSLPPEAKDLVTKIDVWFDTFVSIGLIQSGIDLGEDGMSTGGSRSKEAWSQLDPMAYELTRIGALDKVDMLWGEKSAAAASEWLWRHSEEWHIPWEALQLAERGQLEAIKERFGFDVFKAAHKWVWQRDDFWHPTPYVQRKAQEGAFSDLQEKFDPKLCVVDRAYEWIWQRSRSWHAHLTHYRKLQGHPDARELIDDEVCILNRNQDRLLANVDRHVKALLQLRRARRRLMTQEEELAQQLCENSPDAIEFGGPKIRPRPPIRRDRIAAYPRGHIKCITHNAKKKKRSSGSSSQSVQDVSDQTSRLAAIKSNGGYGSNASKSGTYKGRNSSLSMPGLSWFELKPNTAANTDHLEAVELKNMDVGRRDRTTLHSLEVDSDSETESAVQNRISWKGNLWLEAVTQPVEWSMICDQFEVVKTIRDKPLGHHEEAIEGDFRLIGSKKPKKKAKNKDKKNRGATDEEEQESSSDDDNLSFEEKKAKQAALRKVYVPKCRIIDVAAASAKDLELYPIEGTDKDTWRDAGRGSYLRASMGIENHVMPDGETDDEDSENENLLTDEYYDKLHTSRLAYIKEKFDVDAIRTRYNITAPMPKKAARRGGNWHPSSSKSKNSAKDGKNKVKPKSKPKSKSSTKASSKTSSNNSKKRKANEVSDLSSSGVSTRKRRTSNRNRSRSTTPVPESGTSTPNTRTKKSAPKSRRKSARKLATSSPAVPSKKRRRS